MDNYTKQCDRPLIQDGWEPKVGDRAKLKFYRTGFVGIVVNLHMASRLLIDLEQGYGNQYQHELIWLPSIEQLVDMVKGCEWQLNYYCMESSYTCEILNKGNRPFPAPLRKTFKGKTSEEALIQAVMHELHGLRWDGERWVP